MYEDKIMSIWENKTHESGPKMGLRKHITAAELSKIVPKYKTYRKFAIVRNPWDRAVSWYTYVKRLNSHNPRCSKGLDFAYFIKNMKNVWNGYGEPTNQCTNISQWSHISYQGNLMVDKVLKYEDLKRLGFKKTLIIEMSKLKIKLGKTDQKMLRLNKSPRKKDYHYYYDNETREIVAHACKTDIRKFNYTF
jgi:hypothetical protein